MSIKSNDGILAYKVFRRSVVQGETKTVFTCGHDGCAKHRKVEAITAPIVTLTAAYTNNKQLQKVGDKASLPDHISIALCNRGWHAVPARFIPKWTSMDSWRSGTKTVFRVRLSGEVKRGKDKIVARSVELLEEIPYNSAKGKALRVLIAKQKQQHARRERERIRAAQLKYRKKQALKRLRERAVDLHNNKIRRAIRKLVVRQNRVLRLLKRNHSLQYKALVKKLGGWRR